MTSSLAAVIIGNEILSGRRRDAHLANTIAACNARGLRLRETVYLGDDSASLVATFRRLHAQGTSILSFGGIGATPDDKTRQAVAEALALPLAYHREGLAILDARFGDALTENRRHLVHFPEGATLIPNPINQIPGFSIADIHCVPGFPQMAEPMIAWVLDTHCRHLAIERFYCALLAHLPESEAVPLINMLEARYPDLSISSLPQMRLCTELGFEGPQAQALAARRDAAQWLADAAVAHDILDSAP